MYHSDDATGYNSEKWTRKYTSIVDKVNFARGNAVTREVWKEAYEQAVQWAKQAGSRAFVGGGGGSNGDDVPPPLRQDDSSDDEAYGK